MHRLQRVWVRRGPAARLLLPLAWLYGLLWWAHALAYRLGLRRRDRLPVPVIVVGNLIVGGAGKTPIVRAIVDLLRAHGFTPGVVSRGYRGNARSIVAVQPDSQAAQVGDEPLLLRLRSGAPVVVGRDRPAAARELLRSHPTVDVIVSDDGLQHLALQRDVSVVVFDERGAGNGWLLPAGPLREPLPRAVDAATLVIYNTPAPSTRLPGHVSRRLLAGAVELAAWWAGAAPSATALRALGGRKVLACAGLARPGRFFDMLGEAGLEITPLALPDHHDYATLPWPADTAEVLVTEKDAVKLHPERTGSTRVWVVALDFRPSSLFDERLLQVLSAHHPTLQTRA